jgi:hypothetical protein
VVPKTNSNESLRKRVFLMWGSSIKGMGPTNKMDISSNFFLI